jgi:hypothetical protein
MAYANRTELELMFGKNNIEEWADLDGDKSDATIASRIAAALDYADGEINSRLRMTMYTLPLVKRNTTSTVPREIVDIAKRFAAVWLYESRGVREIDPETGRPVHRLFWQKEHANEMLNEIASFVRHLDCELSATPVPEAVTEDG